MKTKRSRRSGVEDRWYKTIKGPDGGPEKVKSAKYGQGRRWNARWVDDHGNEGSKTFERKSEAQSWLDTQVTAPTVAGSYIPPGAGAVTVAEVYERWISSQSHISAKTKATRESAWRSRVGPRWGDSSVGEVKTAAVRAWINELKDGGLGVPGIENSYGLLRQVLGAAVEETRIPRNPCEGVKLPKRKHPDRGYLSHIQVAALADAVDRDPTVVRFLAYTGLRWGEMAALRVGDFEMLRRRVNVSRSVTESGGLIWSTPKTWERRSVPLTESLANELSALMTGKARDDLVFTDQRGGVLRNSNWRSRVFKPAVEACREVDDRFPSITPHDLRHTAASLAVSAGANVLAVQRMLGHAKASMTLDVYADLFDGDLDSVSQKMDEAIRAASGG